jgi:hypothetical protein
VVSAAAEDVPDWRLLTKTENRPMISTMEIGHSIRGHIVEN